MARKKTQGAGASASTIESRQELGASDYVPPPCWALPDEPPFITNEKPRSRNRRYDRKLAKQPLEVRLAEAEISVQIELAWARDTAYDPAQRTRHDVHLGWAVFHGTRAAILRAMISSKGAKHE